jgi:hypothetical protein
MTILRSSKARPEIAQNINMKANINEQMRICKEAHTLKIYHPRQNHVQTEYTE